VPETPDTAELLEIAGEAEAYDAAAPLDEATLLTLRHRPEEVRAWAEPGGFAMVTAGELSLVVRPTARAAGLGGRLLARVLVEAGDPRLQAWSHGDHPAAAALARRHGFARTRELWVMRLPVSGPDAVPVAVPEPPAGVELRGFSDAWRDEVLRVNAAAFASHPEQGSLDEAGFAERTAEPWWDPAGLILAVEGERLLGFHWTKRHSADLGEVYVVGVDPAAQGRGLGKVLTAAGLAHLVAAGVREIHLYVESDNAPAVGLYTGLGFTHAPSDTHVQYTRRA